MSASSNDYVIEYFVFARSKDGSPVRWIANGHRTIAVGLTPLNRCRHLGVPWESKPIELVVLRMLAACPRVAEVVSQPLSLYFGVRGIRTQLRYTPDVSVWVHPSFREELAGGEPLHEIVAKPFPQVLKRSDAVELTFELKSDEDKSLEDDVDEVKRKMVEAIYEHVGKDLFLLTGRKHIDKRFTAVVMELGLAAHDRVGVLDKARCSLAFGDRECLPFGQLSKELGGQPSGERMVKALHYKDFVSIDLRGGLDSMTPVWIRQGA
ncbi:hypothetical protein [Rhizobium leguminosarum]|uniref:hypothetical protein n=1 Tax=Rhizobium leguminosarum TaxID=384 RepID=UPI0013BF15F2|nr:hypothetical protein [Rhizobium leguminosarum]NEJ43597.1 hypothetical protein [Rhizobium leguminosarum]NKL82106.1 hypothetical protein [Rhizobium leguminosarum bv. viciae]